MTEITEMPSVETDLVDKKEISKLEEQIIRQIEYYFGDINLGRDKFLREEVAKDSGWVPLETMLKFNRLKSLSDNESVVAAAVAKSSLMEVSEDNKKIRRSLEKPLKELTKDDLKQKTVYAKGFPLDATLDQVMEFFEGFGQTDNIHMRKDMKKAFKGSCFVVFAEEESAKKFIETPDVKFGDNEMIRLLKDDYFSNKMTQRKQKSEEKAKKSDELKQEKDKEEREKLKEKMTCGAILNVEGIPKETKREDIKNFFQKFGSVEWVDFDSGDTKSRIRFGSENAAKDAIEKAQKENEGKIQIGGVEVQCRVLEGDEELDHWAGIYKAKQERLNTSNNKKKKRFGDRRGGPPKKRSKQAASKEDSCDDDE